MQEYWNKTDWSQDTPSFSTVFTCDRFFQLQSAVHFPQIDGDTSKLQKVQAIVQHFSQQFQEHYVPEQQVSSDESLIGFEGREPAIQYMLNKHHHRFGSSCSVYVKVQLVACIVFPYTKEKIKIVVDMVCLMIYV